MNNSSNPFEPKIIENVDNVKSNNSNVNQSEENSLINTNSNNVVLNRNNEPINTNVAENKTTSIINDSLQSSLTNLSTLNQPVNNQGVNINNTKIMVENIPISEIKNGSQPNMVDLGVSNQSINSQTTILNNNESPSQNGNIVKSIVQPVNASMSSQTGDNSNNVNQNNTIVNGNLLKQNIQTQQVNNNLFNNVSGESSTSNTINQTTVSNINSNSTQNNNNIYSSLSSNNNQVNQNKVVEQSKLQQILNSPNMMLNNTQNNNMNSNSVYNQNNNYNNTSNQNGYFINNNGNVNNVRITNDDLLETFVGKNYAKIMTRKFNFAGFFLTALYMLYRKMFGYSLLIVLLNIIISLAVSMVLKNEFILYGILLLINFVIGFSVNKMYISFARKKIDKMKYSNPQMNMQDIKSMCHRKGGTSIGFVFLGALIHFIIVFLIGIILSLTILKSQMNDIWSLFGLDSKIIDGLNFSLEKYNGFIETDTSIIIDDEFSVDVPSEFVNESSSYEYKYSYNKDDICDFNFFVVKGRDDATKFINEVREYEIDSNPSELKSEIVNDINWNWIRYDDAFGNNYYYGTTKNNRLFLLKYLIRQGDLGKCNKFREDIINSIEIHQ